MSTKKKIIAIIIGIEAIVIAAVIAFLFYINSDTVKVNRQLELAQRYLLEEDYEQAIAAFEVVIEIDPKNAEAYLGLAEAYEATDDIENMVKILERGSKRTDSDEISELLKEHKEEIEKKELAAQRAAEAAQQAANASQTNSNPLANATEVPAAQPEEATPVTTGFVVMQDGEICYYDEQGNLVTGWFEVGSNRYCARIDGRLYKDGRHEIESVKYEFDSNGICLGEAEDDAWKQAYIDYIQQNSISNIYTLFYMNNDNIPELFVWSEELVGNIVTADNTTGEYYVSGTFDLYGVQCSVYYMEYQNFVNIEHWAGGNLIVAAACSNSIYSIVNGIASQVDCGGYDAINTYDDSDNYIETIETYSWGSSDQEISEEEYYNRIHTKEVKELNFQDGNTAKQTLDILGSY